MACISKLYNPGRTLKSFDGIFYVSNGNKKLVSNDKVLFLIWNIPARITCPYATEHCKKFCYAVKSEQNYPDCLPCRERNFRFSQSDDFVPSMIAYIEIKLNNLKPGRKIYFRIHESGDFYNQKYVDKWLMIIAHFANDNRIVFMAYTKSVLFFVGKHLSQYKNFVLRFSIWDDTDAAQIAIAEKLELPIYTALSTDDLAKEDKGTYFFCACEDCANCGACYSNLVKRIICLIH